MESECWRFKIIHCRLYKKAWLWQITPQTITCLFLIRRPKKPEGSGGQTNGQRQIHRQRPEVNETFEGDDWPNMHTDPWFRKTNVKYSSCTQYSMYPSRFATNLGQKCDHCSAIELCFLWYHLLAIEIFFEVMWMFFSLFVHCECFFTVYIVNGFSLLVHCECFFTLKKWKYPFCMPAPKLANQWSVHTDEIKLTFSSELVLWQCIDLPKCTLYKNGICMYNVHSSAMHACSTLHLVL